jgi:hypothetical protein
MFKFLQKARKVPEERGGGRGFIRRVLARPPEIDESVWGVFAYLDAVFSAAELEAFDQSEVQIGARHFARDSVSEKIRSRIEGEFRLMHKGSPIRKALDVYRLYHFSDMSCALTCAYHLNRRGQNPNPALMADYAWKQGGTMQWRSLLDLLPLEWKGYDTPVAEKEPDSLEVKEPDFFGLKTSPDIAPKQERDPDPRPLEERRPIFDEKVRHLYREGDRLVDWNRIAYSGTVLLRGDRLVWQGAERHYYITEVPEEWCQAIRQFEELGGAKAFLAGKFDWYRRRPVGPDNPRPMY